jgi:hypothetical protein
MVAGQLNNKIIATFIKNKFSIFIMSIFGTIREIFELFVNRRKFYMFPIIILLIVLMGFTALAQSGLVAFIYPI